MAIELRVPPGRGGMGGKRNPGYPMKRLTAKEGNGLNRMSPRRKKNNPIWESLRDFIRDILIKRHGFTDGRGTGTNVYCGMCKGATPVNLLQPDHIHGREAEGPGVLNPFWDPTNIQWLCDTCHRSKTEPPPGFGADHNDYSAINHPQYRADTMLLKAKIMEFLGPIAGELKYPDNAQADAILFAIGKLDTCDGCGNLKCECEGDGERPVE